MNLLKALAAVSSMTLLSRILGFVRDTVVARAFGAGLATDAFFVAFKIPNLLRRLFAEGAFSQAFVPIFAEYKNRRGEADARVLVDHVSGVLALALAVVTLIGIAAALLNLTFIGFALWAAPYFNPPIKALAWAVFCGGVLQLALQIPFLLKLKML